MISARIIGRDVWEKTLIGYGCYPQPGLTPLNTAEWWRWPFPGAPFTVPADEDGNMDHWALQRIIADMARLAPEGFEFGDTFNDPAE